MSARLLLWIKRALARRRVRRWLERRAYYRMEVEYHFGQLELAEQGLRRARMDHAAIEDPAVLLREALPGRPTCTRT